jgi:hypothetical protein
MTSPGLADAINEHVFRSTGKRGAVNANHVGKWERGGTRWPAALRAVLDVTTDAELGFRPPQRATVDSVDRKTFLKTTLGASAELLLARHSPMSSAGDLAGILSDLTACYRRMESAVPSDQLTPAVNAHLSLASGIVRERVAHGIRISGVVRGSRLVGVAGGRSGRHCDRSAQVRRRHHLCPADTTRCWCPT